MQTSEAFALLAEIAATILGFSGIVVVLRLKAIEQFGPRLLDMLMTAAAALLFSLIPIPLLLDVAPDKMAKTICVAAFAIFLICHTIYLGKFLVRGRHGQYQIHPYFIGPFAVVSLIVAVSVSREAIYGSDEWTNYIWGLVFLVISAAWLFARMIWMTWQGRHGDA